MIRRAFPPAISLLALGLSLSLAGGCPDDYAPRSFEPAEEELASFLEESFADRNLSFPPTPGQRIRLGLRPVGPGVYERPNAWKESGRRRYPVRPGIWRIEKPTEDVTRIHLLLREPAPLAETEAFNSINELLGEIFADYDDRAYVTVLEPEDLRRHWRGRYFTIEVRLYGVAGDATGLERTYSDVILTDFTPWVNRSRQCKESHETAAAGR
ncbi:hypothetical protein [Nitratifractor sp.]